MIAVPPGSPTPDDEVVQSLWIGDRLSLIERTSIRSFLQNGHQYHLYVYSVVDGIPDGVAVRDANTIVPERRIFRTNGSLSIFSDWFRQELLFANGGYWADLDVVCLKPLRFDDPIVVGKVDSSAVCNAVMRFPRHHPLTRLLADVSKAPNTLLPYDSPHDRRRKLVRKYLLGNRRHYVEWGEASGPSGLTKALRHHRLMKHAKPFHYFYPLHYTSWRCAFDETFSGGLEFFSGSYCVHLWNEKLRRQNIDKNGPFRSRSLVQRLVERYGSDR